MITIWHEKRGVLKLSQIMIALNRSGNKLRGE